MDDITAEAEMLKDKVYNHYLRKWLK